MRGWPVPVETTQFKSAVRRTATIAIVCAGLAGCATSSPDADITGVNDPYENVNRSVHDFNRGVDRRVYRPVANAYGVVFPKLAREGVANFSNNAGIPGQVVNNVLQGEVENTVHNTFRFLINSTLGVVGIFDPATSIGLERRDTDFGETLHVWGVGEGAYVALPFLGPSTQRDVAGDVFDFFLNPLSAVTAGPESYLPTGAWVLENAGDRYEFSNSVDSVLYGSSDSYAQTRQIYLENRRFELGDTEQDSYIDPYEELYNE
ncbi:VacJ family lipoprotein [Qingshengfaniella alkalisoli]|uniref:VacJ family lipoprotein n=1 Tax=Qingshengfaniella alkalisoli TaxID=2599296 RepID=A0A5B8I7R8_9RHOB|nr:VacJ family lipoprotein [Qingshengfaniella alkalisoli]QDY69905.1 VacJ family lipoprotein [Qingshengfaniella alkalisoli]